MTDIFIIRWYHIFVQPFFLIRKRIESGIQLLSGQLTGNLLDFGCGAKPYQQYFTHVVEYIGLDIETSGHSHKNERIDVFYDGHTIPFKNDHFDAIFSSEVFEHIFNLPAILQELYRVLKPGGKLLFTCPFAWPEHEVPFDFARYSSYGIKSLVEQHGFKVTTQCKVGHFFEVIMQYLLFYVFCFLPKKPALLYYVLHQIFILPLLLFTLFINLVLPTRMKRKDLYFNNILVLEKPM
jgi:SAM-dependent methyltransferase